MDDWGATGIPYEVPAHVTSVGEPLTEPSKRKSKYFDLQKDTEVGLHMGSMEEMEERYLNEVCGGIPWKHEASAPC